MKEQSVVLGKQQSMVGIVTHPQHIDPGKPAVLLLNGGLVHRIGPNRVYVKLARCLAEQGLVVLRFDLSGIGDSRVRMDNMPYEKSSIDDVQQAMNFLSSAHGIQNFFLMGHCSGAINSLRTAVEDPRVCGIVMMNPEGGDENWDEYDRKRKESRYYQNYYGKTAFMDPQRWRKLITGKADYRSIFNNIFKTILWGKVINLSFKLKAQFGKQAQGADPIREMMLQWMNILMSRGTRVLFVYTESSTGLERLQVLLGKELKDMVARGKVRMEIVPDSDHNFTLQASQHYLVNLIERWSCS